MKKFWRTRAFKELTTLPYIFGLVVVLFTVYVHISSRGHKTETYDFEGITKKTYLSAKSQPIGFISTQPIKPKRWKNEERCRAILENIYRKPFKSVRPAWLKNPATGHNLEIDCYNEELKLGLEYDGIQHSKYTPYFHRKGEKQFIYGVLKDTWKNKRCKERGITLIHVPHYILPENLKSYIVKQLRKANRL